MRHPIYRPIPVTSGHHYIGRIQEVSAVFARSIAGIKLLGRTRTPSVPQISFAGSPP